MAKELAYYKHKDYDEAYYLGQVKQYETANRFHRFRMQHVYKLDPPQKGERIVDLGCGMGTFAIEASKRGCKVLGIDMSPIAIKYARKLFKKYGKGNGRFIVGSVDHIPMRNKSVDKVYMAGVIEHIPDALFEKALDEVHRVLEDGGKLVFEVPSPDHIIEKLKERNILLREDRTHIGLKNEKFIKEQFRRHGFTIVRFMRLPVHTPLLHFAEIPLMRLPFIGKYFVRRLTGVVRKDSFL